MKMLGFTLFCGTNKQAAAVLFLKRYNYCKVALRICEPTGKAVVIMACKHSRSLFLLCFALFCCYGDDQFEAQFDEKTFTRCWPSYEGEFNFEGVDANTIIDTIGHCNVVNGDVIIKNVDLSDVGLKDMFSRLIVVNGNFHLYSVDVHSNNLNYLGLRNLRTVKGNMELGNLRWGTRFLPLKGMSGLRTIKGRLVIQKVMRMNRILAFANLLSANSVVIAYNDNLANCLAQQFIDEIVPRYHSNIGNLGESPLCD